MANVENSGAMMVGLVVMVAVAVLVLIFSGSLSASTLVVVQDDVSAIADYDVTEESFTSSNSTAVELNNLYVQSGTLSIYNGSGYVWGVGNFTIDYDAGTILGSDDTTGTTLYANYTYGQAAIRDNIIENFDNAVVGLSTSGQYLPIIVLAVIMSFFLTILFGGMFFGRTGGGSAL